MPRCNDCGYEFKGRDIKICENCGSENISLGPGEFDVEEYKRDMKAHTNLRNRLRCAFVITITVIMIIIFFLI